MVRFVVKSRKRSLKNAAAAAAAAAEESQISQSDTDKEQSGPVVVTYFPKKQDSMKATIIRTEKGVNLRFHKPIVSRRRSLMRQRST